MRVRVRVRVKVKVEEWKVGAWRGKGRYEGGRGSRGGSSWGSGQHRVGLRAGRNARLREPHLSHVLLSYSGHRAVERVYKL